MDVPGLPGAFVLTNFLTKTETAAFRARGARRRVLTRRYPRRAYERRRRRSLDEAGLLRNTLVARDGGSAVAPREVARAGGRGWGQRAASFVPPRAEHRVPQARGRVLARGVFDERRRAVVDASEGQKRSRLTLLAYLSDGFEGGATTFFGAVPGKPGEVRAVAVEPREGAALCFPHGDAEDSPVHEGARCSRARTAPGTSTSRAPTCSSSWGRGDVPIASRARRSKVEGSSSIINTVHVPHT